jgi:hypothetical protein
MQSKIVATWSNVIDHVVAVNSGQPITFHQNYYKMRGRFCVKIVHTFTSFPHNLSFLTYIFCVFIIYNFSLFRVNGRTVFRQLVIINSTIGVVLST